jgi:hypothetical protein
VRRGRAGAEREAPAPGSQPSEPLRCSSCKARLAVGKDECLACGAPVFGLPDPRPALVDGLRRVLRDGLARVRVVFGVDEAGAARLVGERLGLPACQVLSWARNAPLGVSLETMWCPIIEQLENEPKQEERKHEHDAK